jgi:gamma-glutamyltranspeptidase/glutathione hydrolase
MVDTPVQRQELSPGNWEAPERESIERLEQEFFPPCTRMIEGHGVVTTTSSSIAIHAGLRALKIGGTAADAAIAIALTQPTTAFGSYVSYAGVMQALYYQARSVKIHALDAGWNSYLDETDPASIPLNDSGSRDRSR